MSGSDRASSWRPLRVLHCPWNIAGNPGALVRAERKLGIDSYGVELVSSKYVFEIDETLFEPLTTASQREMRRWGLVMRAIRRFDIVHFNFGQSILMGQVYPDETVSGSLRHKATAWYWRHVWMADLPLLKLLGKGIVMTYQGDDARQGDECRRRFAITAANYVDADYYNPITDAWKRKAISKVARYADRIYALNPDLLQVLPSQARFLPYANVDPREWTPPQPTDNSVPVVVHAPTHRGVKGTEFILQAVRRLHSEGIQFKFKLIENLPHAEVRRLYEQADVLVDQLLLGWYGGLAVEFMALQKPVICYMRDEDLLFLPPLMRAELPVVNANPMNIYQVLRDTLKHRNQLPEIGRRSRAYVERWHDPVQIAQELVREYHAIAHCRWGSRRSWIASAAASRRRIRADHGEANNKGGHSEA